MLWHKLTVHERVYKRLGTDKCPIFAQKESIKREYRARRQVIGLKCTAYGLRHA